jgi:23S rRNA (adenine2503-C2)-methyltransferase
MDRKSICGLSAIEILSLIENEGGRYEHALILANSIYKKGISDFSGLSRIPKRLREYLNGNFNPGVYSPAAEEISKDGTKKYLFRNNDLIQFETVFIPDGKRNTVCVSTQSGCRMGCPFCVTGKYGFHGNLDAGDIVNQVIGIPEAEKVTHVVFMGMGEPMDNIGNVLKACGILSSEWGRALSQSNITVSTVGITPGVKQFLENSECNLTISLFSPFPDERRMVVPAETKYPVNDIIKLMRSHPVKKKRRMSVAYVMIRDVNDTDRHLDGLKDMFAGTGIRINLLPYHNTGDDINSSSTAERMMFFKHSLVISGISASVRRSRGADISAACGLLASGLDKKRGEIINNEIFY